MIILVNWKLEVEALDHTLWRTCCGTGIGPVVRQSTWWLWIIVSLFCVAIKHIP